MGHFPWLCQITRGYISFQIIRNILLLRSVRSWNFAASIPVEKTRKPGPHSASASSCAVAMAA